VYKFLGVGMIKELTDYLMRQLEYYPHTKFTMHETIKGLIISYFLNTEYKAIPEMSRYKRINGKTIKRRIDCVVVDKNTLPVLAIEIDLCNKENNYETLMMWDCPRLWIGYSSEDRIYKVDGVNVFNIFPNLNPKNRFKKSFLRYY
jgi:hypothetical protein